MSNHTAWVLLLLQTAILPAAAQEESWADPQMYVCHTGRCDAYEIHNIKEVVFRTDSFQVNQFPAYSVEDVDSIVFRRPDLSIEPLGWWGCASDGTCSFFAIEEDSNPEMHYHVRFKVEVQAGICLSACCELEFDNAEMLNEFLVRVSGDNATTENPYIYVKETLTGPRKYEVWIMDNPILPQGHEWAIDGCKLTSSCSDVLAGRDISEVMVIIEAWVHQPGKPFE